MPRPATKLSKDFLDTWRAISRDLQDIIAAKISAGWSVDRAVAFAVKETNLNIILTNSVLDEVVRGLVIGRGTLIFTSEVRVEKLRKWWLNHHWKGEKLSLSTRIAKTNLTQTISSEISTSMRLAQDWKKTAKNLTDAKLIKADVAGHMWDTIKQARAALKDPAAARAYELAVRRSQAQIDRLARNGAPTQSLKSAYQNVIAATEKGSLAAIDKAIGRAVNQKARYNAQRIARTERARAITQGELERIHYGPDADIIAAVQYDLSSAHQIPDICDVHANADNYGIGPGVYPKRSAPVPPVHPHCRCNLTPVYGDELRGKYNPEAAQKYLRKNPTIAKNVLGVEGAKRINGNWTKKARNWTGLVNTKPEVPKAHRQIKK